MENEALIGTLQRLGTDPALAVVLCEQLYKGRFWALVEDPGADVGSLSFLTYPTADGPRELPVFTSSDRPLLRRIESQVAAVRAELRGERLWRRMLDVVRTGKCEVAVDPGEPHGIRCTREMILGMVNEYGGGVPAE